jgi:hypothetical protein
MRRDLGEETTHAFWGFRYNQAPLWVPERQAFEELLEQIQLTERLVSTPLGSPNLTIPTMACWRRLT